MFEQLPLLDLHAGFFHDDGLDDLPPQQILLADDAGLLHRGVEAEDDLDLPGIDVEAARDDHPLLPAREEDVTVPVHPSEVARMEPAVPDHLGGCLRVLVITLHDVFTPEDQFADGLPRELPALLVDDFRDDAGNRNPDGAGLLGHVETAEGGDGRRLGQAVALHDPDAELLFKQWDEIRGHRRAAGDAEPQGIDPVFSGPLVEEHAEEEPGDGGDIGHPFLFNRVEDPVEREAFHQDDPGADPQRRQHVGDGPEGVEEGDHGEPDIFFVAMRDRPEEDRLGQKVVMGEDGAERLSGQPRRVDHDGGVVAFELRDLRREGTVHDDLPEGGILFQSVRRDEAAAERKFIPDLFEPLGQRPLRDQTSRVAVSEKVAELIRGGLDVQRHGDAADLLNPEIGDDKLRAVGEHQGHLVSLPQTERPEVVRQRAGGPLQLPIGHFAVAVDHGHPFRIFPGAFRQHLSQTHHGSPAPFVSHLLNTGEKKNSTE